LDKHSTSYVTPQVINKTKSDLKKIQEKGPKYWKVLSLIFEIFSNLSLIAEISNLRKSRNSLTFEEFWCDYHILTSLDKNNVLWSPLRCLKYKSRSYNCIQECIRMREAMNSILSLALWYLLIQTWNESTPSNSVL
jgi:hypothetical protein